MQAYQQSNGTTIIKGTEIANYALTHSKREPNHDKWTNYFARKMFPQMLRRRS